MYGTPYIFHFVHPLVKTAEIMVQRVNFERNLKNIRPPTVLTSMPIKSSGRIVPPGWAPLQPKQSVLSLIV